MQANKLPCYCFIDAVTGHETPGQRQRALFPWAKAAARAPYLFMLVGSSHFPSPMGMTARAHDGRLHRPRAVLQNTALGRFTPCIVSASKPALCPGRGEITSPFKVTCCKHNFEKVSAWVLSSQGFGFSARPT